MTHLFLFIVAVKNTLQYEKDNSILIFEYHAYQYVRLWQERREAGRAGCSSR